MGEVLKAIAMLCAIHTGDNDQHTTQRLQSQCQTNLVKCMKIGPTYDLGTLYQCVEKGKNK